MTEPATTKGGAGEDNMVATDWKAVLGPQGMEDMIKLSDLTEQSILWNLHLRYAAEIIYTYTGSILVAVNPYKMFNIYGLDMVKKYAGQVIGSQPPHLFAIGSASYGQMVKDHSNQVIVISGESGAGKTESTKLIMQYLAAENSDANNLITERILEANPLLESFGNAKTIRNDNSSRFGKYVEVYFKGGNIVGAKTKDYLLEKSRIVSQNTDERNYHIFYELLVGLNGPEKERYGLQTANKYFYLNQGGNCEIPTKSDLQDFQHLKAAMDVLGFISSEKETIYKILASVLHLGNVYFKKVQPEREHSLEGVALGSGLEVRWVSKLLELPEDWLTRALTCKVTEARQERMLSPLSIDQALDARDAIAKVLYARLFSWLVERINSTVLPSHANSKNTTSIAILDIFGFEDFHANSFEQLCINYANETLQLHFNQHVFQLEQAEYARENIHWQNIQFHDNHSTINLIGRKPNGILHILDDESNFPKGTDQSFLEKCHHEHQGSAVYQKPRMVAPEFSIQHYAGTVTYHVKHFLDKNKDTLRADVVELLITSKNQTISKMFKELRDAGERRTLSKMTGFYVTQKPKTPTVAASFHESLSNLIETMTKCTPWFVRCIKPNTNKAPMMFQPSVVLDQLRYTGMLETIKIRKMGFPVRIAFERFADRYFVLLPGSSTSHQPKASSKNDSAEGVCERILRSLPAKWHKCWQIGRAKVFLKETLGYHLDELRNAVVIKAVVRLQCLTRTFLQQRRYHRIRRASVILQAGLRRWIARTRYQRMRQGFIRTQAQFRMRQEQKRYKQMKSEVVGPQSNPWKNRELLVSQARKDYEQGEMSHVAGLVIPADLAHVFSKLDTWNPPHVDSNLVTVSEHVELYDHHFELPVDINQHAFSKYAQIFFKDQQWRPLKQPIKTPFLPKQTAQDTREAVALFQLILRHMNDANLTRTQRQVLGQYIIQRGMASPAQHDELLVQLVNQTWQNKRQDSAERGWLLLAGCLSCFGPSPTLRPYLLKYVSDHGFNGYKAVCQHKLLAGAAAVCGPAPAPAPRRVYPPCLLEWKAAARHSGLMALAAHLPGRSGTVTAPVHSWMSGQECAHQLLKAGGYHDGTHGWTVQQRDNGAIYESAGHEYIMDLMGEMELPPGFPYTQAYNLVSADKRETRHGYGKEEDAHDPLKARKLGLEVDEMRSARPVPPRKPLPPDSFFQYLPVPEEENPYSDAALSKNSKLNQRHKPTDPTLQSSALNARYTQSRPGSAHGGSVPPTSPPLSPRSEVSRASSAKQPGLSEDSMLNNRYMGKSAIPPPQDLSTDSRLNQRYQGASSTATPAASTNGDVPNGDVGISESKLNNRYRKGGNAATGGAAAAANQGYGLTTSAQIAARQNHMSRPRSQSSSSELPDGNFDQWVDNVFGQALDSDVEDLHSAHSLANHLKGGGDQRTANGQTSSNGLLNGNIGGGGLTVGSSTANGVVFGTTPPPATAFSGPTTGSIPLASTGYPQVSTGYQMSTVGFMPPPQPLSLDYSSLFGGGTIQPQQASQLYAQQQAAQFQTQQQLAGLQQQLSVANRLRAAEVEKLQQEATTLQAQLQTQALHNQLLQQSVQSEILKQQLQQLQQQNTEAQASAARVQASSPLSASGSGSVSGAASTPSPRAATSPMPENPRSPPVTHKVYTAPGSQGGQIPVPPSTAPKPTQEELDAAAAKRAGVKTLTREFEKKKVSVSDVFVDDGHQPAVKSNSNKGVKFSENVQTIPQVNKSQSPPPPPPVAPPPPPPSQAAPPPRTEPVPSTLTSSQPSQQAPAAPVASATTSEPIRKAPPGPPPAPIREHTTETGQKIIRVGKIQWPPVKEEAPKEEVEVGKLDIDEKEALDREKKVSGSAEVRERVSAMIREKQLATLKQQQEEQDRKQKQTSSPRQQDAISIDMKERKALLAAQLQPKKQPTPESSPRPYERSPPPPKVPTPRREEPPKSVVPPIKLPPPSESSDSDKGSDHVDFAMLERVQTALFSQPTGPFFTYARVGWRLEVRKEVFAPSETIENEAIMELLFAQIVQDIYDLACIRIGKDDRMRMRSMLDSYGVTPRSIGDQSSGGMTEQAKRLVIDRARDWPYYFSRMFPVNGGRQHPQVDTLSVSHSGVRLLQRERDVIEPDNFHVLNHFRFEEIIDVSVPQPSTVQIHVGRNYIILYTHRAQQISSLIEAYCIECEKDVMYVRAAKSYITRDHTLLSFQKGDVIKLTNKDMTMDRGWMYGSLHGRAGMFPQDYIVPLAQHEVQRIHSLSRPGDRRSLATSTQSMERTGVMDDDQMSTLSSVHMQTAGAKYTMLEYAMMYFRESPYRYVMKRNEQTGSVRGTLQMISTLRARTQQRMAASNKKDGDWTWRENVRMVRWTKDPIQASLLKLQTSHQNKAALNCFMSIMRYMGDYPLGRDEKTVACAYMLLRTCHTEGVPLVDEVYCQVCKQTTNNKSTQPESCMLGWRLMSIMTSYFKPSDQLLPYLMKYLEENALDPHRPYHELANQCLHNLRTTLKYGGRKNVPNNVELNNLGKGRSSKREMVILPGGQSVILKVRSSTVVEEAVTQLCDILALAAQEHSAEYTLHYVIETESRFCPLQRDEYMFDITTELTNQKKDFYLLFQRTTWVYPLQLDANDSYMEMMYHQCIPDYFDGYFLTIPNRTLPQHVIDDLVLLAALQFRAEDKKDLPQQKDVELKIPRNAIAQLDMSLQRWTNMVTSRLRDIDHQSPQQCKMQFVQILSHWPLFGSTFFHIRSTSEPRMRREGLLAINKEGVHFLDGRTHSTVLFYPFQEIISTRKFKSESGVTCLSIKYGDLMSHNVITVETDLGAAISTLVARYLHVWSESRQNPHYNSSRRRSIAQ